MKNKSQFEFDSYSVDEHTLIYNILNRLTALDNQQITSLVNRPVWCGKLCNCVGFTCATHNRVDDTIVQIERWITDNMQKAKEYVEYRDQYIPLSDGKVLLRGRYSRERFSICTAVRYVGLDGDFEVKMLTESITVRNNHKFYFLAASDSCWSVFFEEARLFGSPYEQLDPDDRLRREEFLH